MRRTIYCTAGVDINQSLKFANTWQGNDLEDCLDFVRETRSHTQF